MSPNQLGYKLGEGSTSGGAGGGGVEKEARGCGCVLFPGSKDRLS